MKFLAQQLGRLLVTLVVGLAALTIAVVPGADEALQFHRAAISAGEVWRLASCHLTHWNVEHLQWDLLMFVVLGGACELRIPQKMRWCVAAAAAVVTGLVLCGFPEIQEYRGLSGIATALFTLLAIELICDALSDGNRKIVIAAGMFVAGFAAKTAYEATTGQTYFVEQVAGGFVPLVWDHLAAGVVGALIALGGGLVACSKKSGSARRPTRLRANDAT